VNSGLKDRTQTTVDMVLTLHGDSVVEAFVIIHTMRQYYTIIKLHRIAL